MIYAKAAKTFASARTQLKKIAKPTPEQQAMISMLEGLGDIAKSLHIDMATLRDSAKGL